MLNGWVDQMVKDIESENNTNNNNTETKVELSADDIEKIAEKVIEKLNNNSFDIETEETTNETGAEETGAEESEE